MSHKGTFGDHITLIAAAALFDIQVVVISSNVDFPPRLISKTDTWCATERFIIVGHSQEGMGEHYVSIAMPACDSPVFSELSNKLTSTKSGSFQFRNDATTSVPGPDHSLRASQTTLPNVTGIDLGNLVDGPAQPVLDKYPSSTFGKQNRAFCASLYKSYSFIEYSIVSDAIFCFPCRLFESSTDYKDVAFTEKGFKDWKKIREKLDKHVSTNTHLDCVTRWNA